MRYVLGGGGASPYRGGPQGVIAGKILVDPFGTILHPFLEVKPFY